MPFIGRSKEGYGSKRGWVSLFDLSAPHDTDIRETLLRYYFFKAFRESAEICILFITPNAWSSLISWQRARREVAGKSCMFLSSRLGILRIYPSASLPTA
jgi:hypothetical protein